MLGTLLVPLDGSRLAERALPYAEGLIAQTDGKLVLVRSALASALTAAGAAKDQMRAVEEAEIYLHGIAKRLSERGISAEAALPYGPAAEMILEEIRIRRADLVVMATHGRSGLGRWIYGSVAEGVLGRSRVPVMLVRAWEDEKPAAEPAGPRRLIVPLDGSTFAEAALPVAQELATKLGGELILVRVVSFPILAGEDTDLTTFESALQQVKSEAQTYLEGTRDGLIQATPSPEVKVEVRVGTPVQAITSASIEHQAAIVVMATHGRTGLPRAILGSVADAVLRNGSIPVLFVRPAALPLSPSILAPRSEETSEAGPPLALAVGREDVRLIRTALETLSQSVTRHEHLHGRIHRLLRTLPNEADLEEPGSAADRAGVGLKS